MPITHMIQQENDFTNAKSRLKRKRKVQRTVKNEIQTKHYQSTWLEESSCLSLIVSSMTNTVERLAFYRSLCLKEGGAFWFLLQHALKRGRHKGPNHTQYKISLTFLYKTTFERELRPHPPSCVTFSYKSPSTCTTKQNAHKCRVPRPSRKTTLLNVSFYTPSECHLRCTLC